MKDRRESTTERTEETTGRQGVRNNLGNRPLSEPNRRTGHTATRENNRLGMPPGISSSIDTR